MGVIPWLCGSVIAVGSATDSATVVGGRDGLGCCHTCHGVGVVVGRVGAVSEVALLLDSGSPFLELLCRGLCCCLCSLSGVVGHGVPLTLRHWTGAC